MVMQSENSISKAAALPMAAGSASAVVPNRALYSPKEAANVLGVSHATLYRLINAGRLDARKILAKTVITAESVENLLASLPKAGCCA